MARPSIKYKRKPARKKLPSRRNVPDQEVVDRIAKAEQGGQMPLDYMLEVMRDTQASTARRDEMAKAAAPYVHPRLSSVEIKEPPIDLSNLTDDELEQLAKLYRIAVPGSHPDGAPAEADASGKADRRTRH